MTNRTAGIMLLSLAAILVVGFAYMVVSNQEAERLAFTVPPASTQEEPFIQSDANSVNPVVGILVDGFPPEAPIYPNAKLIKSNEVVYDGKTNYSAKWESSSKIQEIVSFYRQQISANNWEILRAPELTGPSSTSGEQQIHYRTDKYNGYVTVEIEEAPNTTEIVLELIPV